MAGAPQGYIGRNPGDGRTVINRQTTHVTTNQQESFTMTVGYEVGFLDVYLNGIKQTETLDYTASDGSTINFSPSFGPVNGDVLEFIAYETLNITNIKSARRNFNVGQDLSVDGSVTIGSSLTVASDLVVNGTFTTINTEILDVEDKTVGIASTSSPSNTTADGAGIVIYGGSDGDKSITWNTEKSNFVIVGGGVSIGTGVTISTPAANVLAFSVNSAEKARFNNFGAFTVGYEGEAWHESTYVGVLQAGSGAWIGQTPGAGARAEWVNNAYYDSVNTRWEYIAADEANRIYLENGELHLQSAAAGSADGLITWNERLAMTVGGDFKIGPNAGIGITISSSGNVDAIGIITASSFRGDGSNLEGINTDLVSDTSPQLGGNLDVNTKNIVFGDSGSASDDRLTFGAGTDLSIYHDGTRNIIDSQSTQLRIETDALRLRSDSGETYIEADANGSVKLYYDNSLKLESKGYGVTVSGHVELASGSDLFKGPDNAKLNLGDGNDIQLYHDGSHSRLKSITGQLWLQSDNGIRFTDADVNESMAAFYDNGAVELYYDGAKKFETTNAGVQFTGTEIKGPDSCKFVAGTSGDADFYHDGSATYLRNATGNLHIRSDNNIQFQPYSGDELYAKFINDGAVELYYDNSKKFETFSSGVKWTGLLYSPTAGDTIQFTGANSNAFLLGMTSGADSPAGNDEHLQFHHWNGSAWEKTFFVQRHSITIPDSNKIQIGTSADLEIYHDGSHSYIDNGTGSLRFRDAGGAEKFRISGQGTQFNDDITLSNDNDKINIGAGSDLQLWHDGSHSYIKNATNYVYYRSTQHRFQNAAGTENQALFLENAGVELYYNNSHKFSTTNGGVSVHGLFDMQGLYMQGNSTAGGLVMYGSGSQSRGVVISHGNNNFRPTHTNAVTLGTGSYRWSTVYSNNSLNTSDKNLKNTITDSDLGLSFINKLRPVSYKWNQKEEENLDTKTHYGLIAQEVETALASESKTLDDFAAVFKPDDYKEDGTGGSMGLGYSELIAPLIKAVQELKKENDDLKNLIKNSSSFATLKSSL